MATKPSILIMTTALAIGGLVAGCSGDDAPAEPTPADTATAAPSKAASPTPKATPTETPEPEGTEEGADAGTGALPDGFPDPESLIGQVVHDEMAADESWHTVVGDTPLPLVVTLGACFDGGSGDICGYSVSASVPASGGAPQPATAALILLLRSNGPLPDGSPTWVVLDALATTSPGSEPAYLEWCDGTDGIVTWVDPDATLGATIPALEAWGPDAGITSFVEVDPASLSCPSMGG